MNVLSQQPSGRPITLSAQTVCVLKQWQRYSDTTQKKPSNYVINTEDDDRDYAASQISA